MLWPYTSFLSSASGLVWGNLKVSSSPPPGLGSRNHHASHILITDSSTQLMAHSLVFKLKLGLGQYLILETHCYLQHGPDNI